MAIKRRVYTWPFSIPMSGCVIVLFVSAAAALPPLGLTRLGDDGDLLAQISVVNDVAYVSGTRDIWVVDPTADVDTIRVTHPDLGVYSHPTRVVTGPNDVRYVGATFFRTDDLSFSDGVALFELDVPDVPLVTWQGRFHLVGIGSDLRGVANREPTGQPVRLLADGTFQDLQFPQGTLNMEGGFVNSMSESGYAVGSAFVPGTIGDAASLWTPTGNHAFLDAGGSARSVRDRSDGSGINIGWRGSGGFSMVKYGTRPPIQPRDPISGRTITSEVLVSEVDFAVLRLDGFQPGLVQGQPDIALPIEQLFPELAMADIDRITDVTAVDGHIFMTLSGPDGLYLFGARDPSVIPEPATWVLLMLAGIAVGLRVCWRGRG